MGMLMTADGSEDDRIHVQGFTEQYSFTDADGGSEGAESEVELDEEEHADVRAGEGGEEGEEGEEGEQEGEEGEGEEAEGGDGGLRRRG
jgi:hypothetical protein